MGEALLNKQDLEPSEKACLSALCWPLLHFSVILCSTGSSGGKSHSWTDMRTKPRLGSVNQLITVGWELIMVGLPDNLETLDPHVNKRTFAGIDQKHFIISFLLSF